MRTTRRTDVAARPTPWLNVAVAGDQTPRSVTPSPFKSPVSFSLAVDETMPCQNDGQCPFSVCLPSAETPLSDDGFCAIDPTGSWLFAANQNSGGVVVFRIDPKTGRLAPAGQKLEIASPVCVRFAAMR